MHIIPFLILFAIICCAVFPSVESTIGAIIIIIGQFLYWVLYIVL